MNLEDLERVTGEAKDYKKPSERNVQPQQQQQHQRVHWYPERGIDPVSHKSYICQQQGHDSSDCNVGWCECPCHELDKVFRENGWIE